MIVIADTGPLNYLVLIGAVDVTEASTAYCGADWKSAAD
jgi:hypothetical protein